MKKILAFLLLFLPNIAFGQAPLELASPVVTVKPRIVHSGKCILVSIKTVYKTGDAAPGIAWNCNGRSGVTDKFGNARFTTTATSEIGGVRYIDVYAVGYPIAGKGAYSPVDGKFLSNLRVVVGHYTGFSISDDDGLGYVGYESCNQLDPRPIVYNKVVTEPITTSCIGSLVSIGAGLSATQGLRKSFTGTSYFKSDGVVNDSWTWSNSGSTVSGPISDVKLIYKVFLRNTHPYVSRWSSEVSTQGTGTRVATVSAVATVPAVIARVTGIDLLTMTNSGQASASSYPKEISGSTMTASEEVHPGPTQKAVLDWSISNRAYINLDTPPGGYSQGYASANAGYDLYTSLEDLNCEDL